MASKKKQEQIEKQIDIKKQFADKVYKKMRADRYGLTFCCPNDLEKINVKNYMCNWQDIGYEVMPEKFDKNYTRNPIANYCAPPGIYNPVTGLCDAEAELELVGVTEFTTAEAVPNGTPSSIVPANDPRYGKDCPIIFESINQDGTGTNPFMIQTDDDNDPDNSWWKYYDATDPNGEFFNPLNPNVTELNFCNALAKRPSGGWPSSVTYEWAVNVTPTATTTYHVAICADHKFGLSTTTSGVTTDLIGLNTFNALNITQSIGEADSNWDPDGSGAYTWQGLIQQQGHDANECHASSVYYYMQSIDEFTGVGDNNRVSAARWFIYPITLDAGCHRINIKGFNKDFEGMLAAVVWQNSKAEILAAESRSELTEIFASDLQTALYQNINNSEPWTCDVGVLTTTSPFSADCPGCRQETSTLVQQCPEGYTYNNSTQKCEGIFSICDTETLVFEVVNQNGEVMPNYEITFDGGTYTTNELGYLEIVIQNASVDTDHNLNLCHCITTGGGCAIQNIKITVTDSNAIVCTPVDELCPCKAPALINTTTGPVLTNPSSITLTFQDFNLNNSSNTIESYIFEYRVYTAAGDGGWEIITIAKPASVTTFTVNLSLSAGSTYEYRIKTKCTETESGYSGVYSITIPDTFGEDLIGWWDFTDKSSLFTDLAGTTNPANEGDPIRRVNNKSTSTKKLGNFLRSVETLGWTNVVGSYPRYAINSTISQSYADMSSGVPFNQTAPFIGASDAGFGGVNDGVSFTTLNNFNNRDFTIINVILNDANTIGNANIIQFVFNLNGERNTGTGYIGVNYSVDGTGMAPGNKFTRATIFENVGQTTPGIIIPFVNAGMELTVIRSTSDSDNNVLGRNEWDANNATFYNQVNNFNLPDAETLDISGSTVGLNSPGFSLGGFRYGSNVTGPWRGEFYESLVFNKALSDADLNDVVSYLKTKYGII